MNPVAETEFFRFAVEINSEAYQLNPTNRYACRANELEALLRLKRYDELMDRASVQLYL